MAILLPTPENTRFLKSILMEEFSMRSAHASEAIASLIGFSSHASLRASPSDFLRTVHQVDFEAFEARSARLGYDTISSEYLRNIYAEINWPEPAWKLVAKRDSTAQETWFKECKKRNLPFLYVSKARKYYSVNWDHISMDSNYDELVRSIYGHRLGQILFNTYKLIATGSEPKSFFQGSAFVGEITGLSETSARQIANTIASQIFPGNVQTSSP